MLGLIREVFGNICRPRVVNGFPLSNTSTMTTVIGVDAVLFAGDSHCNVSIPKPTSPPPQFTIGTTTSCPQVSIAKPTSPPPEMVSVAVPCAPPPVMESNSLKKPSSSNSYFRGVIEKRSKKETKRFPPPSILPGCHPEDIEAARKKIPLDYILTTNNTPLFGDLGIQVQMKIKEDRERVKE